MSAIEQLIEVALLMAGADFGDRSRIAAPHLGISWMRAASDGGLDARARTLSDQGAFKLREGSQHLGHQHALCAGSIDRIVDRPEVGRSEEHTSELQSLMRISYAVFCLKKKKKQKCSTTNE